MRVRERYSAASHCKLRLHHRLLRRDVCRRKHQNPGEPLASHRSGMTIAPSVLCIGDTRVSRVWPCAPFKLCFAPAALLGWRCGILGEAGCLLGVHEQARWDTRNSIEAICSERHTHTHTHARTHGRTHARTHARTFSHTRKLSGSACPGRTLKAKHMRLSSLASFSL